MYIKKIVLYSVSVFVGYLMGSYSSYHNFFQSQKSDKDILEDILQMVETRSEPAALREALIVRLANKSDITMYGRQINDILTDKSHSGRKKYDVHPYGKAGVCASALVTYRDSKTEEVYILLGRKYANPTNKAQGLAKQFIIFGGYMKPHPLEGAIPSIENISDEEKDLAEEAILLKKNGYEKTIKHTQKDDNKLQNVSSEKYDVNIEATAIRELYEESGLSWNSTSPPVHMGTRSTYGMTGDKRLHIVVEDYLFDYGKSSHPPHTRAGSDIAEVRWVKLSNIYKDYSMSPQEASSNLSRYIIAGDSLETTIVDSLGEVIDQYANSINMPLKDVRLK
jgi:8-oxo-dGTP pyrophosphatase MutT (NUDIX family)